MKKFLVLVIVFIFQKGTSQELFLVTDPASNVPANSLAINVLQSAFQSEMTSGSIYSIMPEVTYGLNRNLMLRASAFASNKNDNLEAEGGSIYAKYRFYSEDDINSHFRMAAFGRYSFNNSNVIQEQIEIMGNNTGFETGIVATKLIKKLAISSTVSFEKVFDNTSNHAFPDNFGSTATNYTLSFGKLMYPKKYTSLKQTNINLMLEFVGQTINENGKSYLDAVPVIQFIFNSQARLDLAYRRELISSMNRNASNGVYLNLYYTFFNLKN
ncbi:hypothetical protein SAMN05444396_106160 [Flavobacterium segetis]|uniref:MetA-pathway of phenol degradation n=1 Tax=Flavobacterium segetis TaxID=271157 RepID=A0A1M5I6M3_9FLAO|nr:hypothetical protein [Flavobacterium segetis]SHG23550.1 hypothetical protein SAMN05444396_106160 [Flavobacterium segetis]